MGDPVTLPLRSASGVGPSSFILARVPIGSNLASFIGVLGMAFYPTSALRSIHQEWPYLCICTVHSLAANLEFIGSQSQKCETAGH